MQTIAQECGYASQFIDLNLDLYHTQRKFPPLQPVWTWTADGLPYSAVKMYVRLFRAWHRQIQDYAPDYLGISVFSYHSQVHTTLFLKWLKRHGFTTPIIVGGGGVGIKDNQYPDYACYGTGLLEQGLVDYYVVGEGENTLRAILKQELPYPGVNNTDFEPLPDFSSVPVPNFDSFRINDYEYPMNKVSISVEGSRGCVRNCTFCDIKKVWRRYKFKAGADLAQELVELSNKYQIYNFWFNDSLVNGSLRAYRDFIRRLADYNEQQPVERKITWSGQYIVRSSDQIKDEDIRLTKLAGCHTLAVGIESGSFEVRKHMGKPFTDVDIEHTFGLLRHYDIKIFLLMIVGYPTENEKAYNETVEFFKKYRKLAAEGTITGVNLGQTQSIIPDTPLSDMKADLGIEQYRVGSGVVWYNSNSTMEKRIERRVKLQKLAQQLGYRFFDTESQLKSFKSMLAHDHSAVNLPAQVHG
jgi:radical SAM superfamily enzyme YgiQ (UPF0313 family)